jgi:perosamine synthetase
MRVRLSSPDVNESDKAAVMEVLNSSALSLGPKLPAFEQMAAEVAGTRHAIAVNSGTSGLHLCVKAAGLVDGDEVITTPFSFIASANCILYERARPVFVDIDPVTYNLDPKLVESAVTSRTKAILPVHVFGRPCNMNPLKRIAAKHGLTIIEDSCEAIGAKYRGKPVGSLGDAGVFAFYPNKQITTGEGGVIVTNDDSIARQCRSMRNQGRSDGAEWLEHDVLGYNYRLSDINCALGISQLARLHEVLEARRRNAAAYDQLLSDIPGVIPPAAREPQCSISWFVYVVRLADDFERETRDEILRILRDQGVECKNYFPPIHLQPLYRDLFQYREGAFPITEHVADRTIALPFYNRLSDRQIDYVCSSLRAAVGSVRRRALVAGAYN